MRRSERTRGIGPAAVTAWAALAALLATTIPAHADLSLCNRTSYVLRAALGIEEKGATATRGWFRLDPGGCRTVMQGAETADELLVHARALPLYGSSPVPLSGHADLCIGDDDFILAAARGCRPPNRLARFTEIAPSETATGKVATLAEEAEYSDEQARRAGIQRLLVIAGYDASPVDGMPGPKTEAAIGKFLKDHDLPSDAAGAPDFFDRLVAAATSPAATGFSWCNDTGFTVMAAYGVDEKGGIRTRGWFRVSPGKCVRPDVPGAPKRLYSFGEAVEPDGRPVRRGTDTLRWGGATTLCTRETTFELADQSDCAAAGLDATGFAAVDLAGRTHATIRFHE